MIDEFEKMQKKAPKKAQKKPAKEEPIQMGQRSLDLFIFGRDQVGNKRPRRLVANETDSETELGNEGKLNSNAFQAENSNLELIAEIKKLSSRMMNMEKIIDQKV